MDDRLLFLLSKSHFKLFNYLKSQFKSGGVHISPGQMGVLFLLEQKDLRSMSELSNVLEIDNSAITRLVDRLEASGLVLRQANPDDRRQYLIGITEEGGKQAQAAQKISNRINNMIRQGFSDQEIEGFKRILASFNEKFGLSENKSKPV